MKSEKKWMRKPQYNPPISQDKAGFVTYTTYNCSIERVGGFYRLPRETCNRPYWSNTFLMVVAISFFVRGFIAKALMPAAVALSASTR